VSVSAPPPGSTALVAGYTGADYTFTGDYSGGTIRVTQSGTYHLTSDLTSNAAAGDVAIHNFAIQISASNVILDGDLHGITGTGADYVDGISITGDGVTVQNIDSVSEFDGTESSGIWSGGVTTTITGTTVTDNTYGIWSEGRYAMITGNIAVWNGVGIYSGGDDATITDNSVFLNLDGIASEGDGATITDNTAYDNLNDGIYSGGDDATITDNTAEWNTEGIYSEGDRAIIAGNTVRNNYEGIYSDGVSALITGNTATENDAGIWTEGDGAIITDNIVQDNNYGIDSYGASVFITDNTVSDNYDGIYSEGDGVTITGNTVTGSDGGLGSFGDGATITGNTVTGNAAGIGIRDNVIGTSITGNYIAGNTDMGIEILDEVGVGAGNSIYNNYLANAVNVGGAGDPGNFLWNNPAGLTPGTNVMGGPNIAGNYWSNPSGTGWSDARYDPDGYSKTEDYEVVTGSGVFDTAPLVRYPHPGPNRNGDALVAPADSIIPPDLIHIVIVSITLSPGAVPGSPITLTLMLEQVGSVLLPDGALFVFVPANEAAAAVGEFTATVSNGSFDEVTLPFEIPSEPGVYEYSFQPYMVQTDPLTGEEVRVPAGKPVTFTVTVGDNGSVEIRYE